MQDLYNVECTLVSLSIVRNADTLRGVAISRGSWWSPNPWGTLTTWRAARSSRARRTRGSRSWLSWWSCKWGGGERRWVKPVWKVFIAQAQKPTDITRKSWVKMVGLPRGAVLHCNLHFSMAQLKSLTKKKKKSEAVWSAPPHPKRLDAKNSGWNFPPLSFSLP